MLDQKIVKPKKKKAKINSLKKKNVAKPIKPSSSSASQKSKAVKKHKKKKPLINIVRFKKLRSRKMDPSE